MGDTLQQIPIPPNPAQVALEALQFYANAKNYKKGRAMVKVRYGMNLVSQADNGAVARQALQQIQSGINAVKAAAKAAMARPALLVPDDTGLKASPGGVLVPA
jgi:hypothetical protein